MAARVNTPAPHFRVETGTRAAQMRMISAIHTVRPSGIHHHRNRHRLISGGGARPSRAICLRIMRVWYSMSLAAARSA